MLLLSKLYHYRKGSLRTQTGFGFGLFSIPTGENLQNGRSQVPELVLPLVKDSSAVIASECLLNSALNSPDYITGLIIQTESSRYSNRADIGKINLSGKFVSKQSLSKMSSVNRFCWNSVTVKYIYPYSPVLLHHRPSVFVLGPYVMC